MVAVGSKIAVVPNGHQGIVLNGQVKIGEKVSADFGVFPIVKSNGPLNSHALSHLAKDLPKNLLPFLKLVLVGLVVIHIQIMGFALDCHQLWIAGAEHNAFKNPFLFFYHSSRPPFQKILASV